MPIIDLNLISIIVFYSLIALFFFIKRKKVEVQSKILFLYKTKRFNNLLKKIGTKFPRFWKWFGYVGIPIGFIVMILILSYFTYAFINLIYTKITCSFNIIESAVSVVIPGVKIPGASIFIPFWYGIIALFVVILVHEGAHGVIATALKQKIKSAGVGMMAVLPLAFVEPDEKQLVKQPAKTQLAVFSAGTMANFVTAAITLAVSSLIVLFLIAPAFAPGNLTIVSLTKDQPAELAGVPIGANITAINGQLIYNSTDFLSIMQSISPGQTITLEASGKDYSIVSKEKPYCASLWSAIKSQLDKRESLNKTNSSAYLGVTVKQNIQIKPEVAAKYGKLPWLSEYAYQLLYWIFVLNLGIGVINLLPLGPLDGGRMADIALHKGIKNKERAKKLFGIISTLSLILLLANLIAPYIIKAL